MNVFTAGFNYGEFAIVKPLEFERFGFPCRVNPVEFDGIKNADVLTDNTMKRLK